MLFRKCTTLIAAWTAGLLLLFAPFMGQAAPRCGGVFSFSVEAVSQEKVAQVFAETLEGFGNFTSRYHISQSEALTLGELWLGAGYQQIGKERSGVFVSADGRRRFRIDNGSLMGNHSPHHPHIHLELLNPQTGMVLSNNHIPLGGVQ